MSKMPGEINIEMIKKVIHERRAKLFAEVVAKTGSQQSVIDRAMQEIESLREQVEIAKQVEAEATMKLGKSLIKIGTLERQLAVLAEQNEKMRSFFEFAWKDIPMSEYAFEILEHVMNLPNLATPVLNRIKAEAYREAAMHCSKHGSRTADEVSEDLFANADELEQSK